MKKAAVVALVAALTAAACSSSHKGATSTGGGSSTTSGSAGTSTGGSTPSNGQPIKIAYLGFETGTYALPGRHDAVELAIDQLNAAGGIDGHKVEYTAYDSGILPQQTVTAVLKAVADHPTAIIGMPVSSGVQAAGSALAKSGIPTIQIASDNTTDLSQLHVDNMYRAISTVYEEATGTAEYVVSQHPKTVGLFDDSDLNGVANMKIIRSYLQAHGITNIVYREVAQGATDATEAALAMKGADIIVSNGFPQTEGVFVKDLAQNGITAPDVMSYAAPSIIAYGLAPKSALQNDYFLATCAPWTLSSPAAQNYTSSYKAKYPNDNILGSSPYIYDAVMALANAIKADGGDLSAGAINKALSTVSFDGACGPYKADAEHNLFHQTQILKAGDLTQVAIYSDMASSAKS